VTSAYTNCPAAYFINKFDRLVIHKENKNIFIGDIVYSPQCISPMYLSVILVSGLLSLAYPFLVK
uniref:Uncharacterized protein n=1 Tax=Romanomermis culicivorax TaxID=13658 RepID=A0A915KUC4_ROMCU